MPSEEFQALVAEGKKLNKQVRELSKQMDAYGEKLASFKDEPPKKKKGFWDDEGDE